jgi:hypothetical protein
VDPPGRHGGHHRRTREEYQENTKRIRREHEGNTNRIRWQHASTSHAPGLQVARNWLWGGFEMALLGLSPHLSRDRSALAGRSAGLRPGAVQAGAIRPAGERPRKTATNYSRLWVDPVPALRLQTLDFRELEPRDDCCFGLNRLHLGQGEALGLVYLGPTAEGSPRTQGKYYRPSRHCMQGL